MFDLQKKDSFIFAGQFAWISSRNLFFVSCFWWVWLYGRVYWNRTVIKFSATINIHSVTSQVWNLYIYSRKSCLISLKINFVSLPFPILSPHPCCSKCENWCNIYFAVDFSTLNSTITRNVIPYTGVYESRRDCGTSIPLGQSLTIFQSEA